MLHCNIDAMPPRLFVAGSANIDLTFRVPALPRPGVTELFPDYAQGFGGKGGNQAVQAAPLGRRLEVGKSATFAVDSPEQRGKLHAKTTGIVPRD